ncbi:MAG: DUF2283 domain-containing protein [Dehalococcoidia bacterium]|nr:DUF2283 domain-containing protein [Dehalococcoidia bacterium]
MRVTYDPYADAVYIDIARGKGTLETKMLDDWVAVDIGTDRSVIGFEILDASSRLDVEKLKTLEFELLGPPISSEELRAEELAAIRENEAEYEHAQSE